MEPLRAAEKSPCGSATPAEVMSPEVGGVDPG